MEKLLRMFLRSSWSFNTHIRNNPGFKLLGHPDPRTLLEFRSGDLALRGLQGIRAYSITGSERPPSSSNVLSANNINSQKVVRMAAPDPLTSSSMFPSWAKWMAGSVVSLVLSLGSWLNWKKLPLIEGKAEEIMEDIDIVAEVVEKVTDVAEAVSEKVADNLPDDSKLKEAALLVERISKATAEEAQITRDIIHKVDGVKQDVEELVKIGGMVHQGSQGK